MCAGVVVVGTVVVAVRSSSRSRRRTRPATSTRAIGDNRRSELRPIIGITAYAEDASWGAWTGRPRSSRSPTSTRSSAPVDGRSLVPPAEDGSRRRSTDSTASSSPAAPTSTRTPTAPSRIRRPTASARTVTVPRSPCSTAALERDMPVLAVCRGSQVLNVALGGDLEQHVPDRVGHDGHKEVPGTFSEHRVELVTRARDCTRSSGAGRRSSRIITRATAGSAAASARRRVPTTARSRRSRTRPAALRSASSGIPRRATTCASSRSSSCRRATVPQRPCR